MSKSLTLIVEIGACILPYRVDIWRDLKHVCTSIQLSLFLYVCPYVYTSLCMAVHLSKWPLVFLGSCISFCISLRTSGGTSMCLPGIQLSASTIVCSYDQWLSVDFKLSIGPIYLFVPYRTSSSSHLVTVFKQCCIWLVLVWVTVPSVVLYSAMS